MPLNVMLIGAYGNFGQLIAAKLAPVVALVVAGRDAEKLSLQAKTLEAASPVRQWCGDAFSPAFATALAEFNIDWVIHTAGPFQGQSYSIAQACIAAGAHYCDLSDCRAFVNGIQNLDSAAREAGVAVLSGCSSVPSLAAAILDAHRDRFASMDSIEHGISSSARMPGLATVEGVLAYAGKPIQQYRDGVPFPVIGWQGLQVRSIEGLGRRWLVNVDVPDMDIFPRRYGARNLCFKAGAGLKAGTFANWLVAAGVRFGLIRSGTSWAPRLHRLGRMVESYGDGKSAFYMEVAGTGKDGAPLRLSVQLVASHETGPKIPACASVALIRKVSQGYRPSPGARACVGEIELDEYLKAIDAPEHLTLTQTFSEA